MIALSHTTSAFASATDATVAKTNTQLAAPALPPKESIAKGVTQQSARNLAIARPASPSGPSPRTGIPQFDSATLLLHVPLVHPSHPIRPLTQAPIRLTQTPVSLTVQFHSNTRRPAASPGLLASPPTSPCRLVRTERTTSAASALSQRPRPKISLHTSTQTTAGPMNIGAQSSTASSLLFRVLARPPTFVPLPLATLMPRLPKTFARLLVPSAPA